MTFEIPSGLLIRDVYTSRIEPYINKPIIKVLTGQRRVGKSYILYQVMKKILAMDPAAHIIYINKEDNSFDFIRNYNDLVTYFNSVKAKGKGKINHIFIDEIQDIEEFEKAVRSIALDKENDIYITGSNASILSGELATLLAGRTMEFKVNSLSYSEFLIFHKLNNSEESLNKYFVFGGLPFLINLKLNNEIVFEYLKNIYSTVLYRDVVSRFGLRSTYFLEQLVQFLADNTGSVFSAKSISDFLKSQKIMIPHNQVQAYIRYLADACLVHKVARYDIAGKRFFESGEKYYFEDIGIRNAVLGYKPGDRSKILENVVHNELLFRGYEIRTGWKGSHEIDFIATKNNETKYIQVAWTLDNDSAIKREFGNLLEIDDNYQKIVISADEQYRNTINGVEHMNIRRFLTEGIGE